MTSLSLPTQPQNIAKNRSKYFFSVQSQVDNLRLILMGFWKSCCEVGEKAFFGKNASIPKLSSRSLGLVLNLILYLTLILILTLISYANAITKVFRLLSVCYNKSMANAINAV